MKKILSLGLSLLMVFSLLTLVGCGEKKLKLGLGVYTVVPEGENATKEKTGSSELNTTVAAVLLDDAGKIIKCDVDAVSVAVKFDAKGKVEAAGEIKSKYELGESYNMKMAGAKKEWFQQADAFEETVKGKTLDEVKGIKKGDESLTTVGCTIDVNDFVLALEKAIKNAKDSEATEKNDLKVGMAYNISTWQNATAEVAGKAEVAVTVSSVAIDGNKKVVASTNDCVIPFVSFDKDGKIAGVYGSESTTKREAGDSYGMKAASSVGKEWYEQADAFAGYIVGKDEKAITASADNTGKSGTELVTAGCTINVNDMIKATVKAINS